jgi:hypothetical protein
LRIPEPEPAEALAMKVGSLQVKITYEHFGWRRWSRLAELEEF